MKYEVTIAETKVLVVTAEGKTEAEAIATVKKVLTSENFKKRIGARVVANVKEIEQKENTNS